MTPPDGSLHTLDYRIDHAELGDLALNPLTAEFTAAWDAFESKIRRRAQRDGVTPKYSSLATALTAVTGQPVRLFPNRDLAAQQADHGVAALLVTTAAIDPGILATAARAFERLSLGDDQADTLAPLLTGTMRGHRAGRQVHHLRGRNRPRARMGLRGGSLEPGRPARHGALASRRPPADPAAARYRREPRGLGRPDHPGLEHRDLLGHDLRQHCDRHPARRSRSVPPTGRPCRAPATVLAGRQERLDRPGRRPGPAHPAIACPPGLA